MTQKIPLQDAILDDTTVGQLVFDIAEAAELIAVLQKGGPTRQAHGASSSPADLEAAHRALVAREISGMQLRYRFAGEEWWDTLTRTEHGVRLIRISHTRALAVDPETSGSSEQK